MRILYFEMMLRATTFTPICNSNWLVDCARELSKP